MLNSKGTNSLESTNFSEMDVFRKWNDEFKLPENESGYYSWIIEENRRLLLGLILLVIAFLALFIIPGIIQKLPNIDVNQNIIIRFVSIFLFGFLYYRVNNSKSNKQLYLNSFLVMILLCVVQLFFVFNRPLDYLLHIGTDVLVLIVFYLISPSPFRHKVAIAVFFSTLLLLYVYFFKNPPYKMAYSTYFIGLIATNILGGWASVRHGRARRVAYLFIMKEKEAREKIKTLEGTIPICSYCKCIRNEEDHWEQLESYINDRSNAKFSHGICPDCESKIRSEWGLDQKSLKP